MCVLAVAGSISCCVLLYVLCVQAIRVMSTQPSAGHVFNMDGAGADGNATPRFAAYGATKRSLAQLGKSLNAELNMQVGKNITHCWLETCGTI